MSEFNVILSSDSYKYSQFNQYPKGTEYVYSYIESRGGYYDQCVYFGLQFFLKKLEANPVTMEMIDEAESYIVPHGLPFNREGWEYIVKAHNGRLPIEIRALDEGTVVDNKVVLVTIMNTDRKCYWLPSFLETALLKAVWYPTTVATNSMYSKTIIAKYLEMTGTPELIDFKLHDFGFRGVSSDESAMIGGVAHLVNFKGTDTVAALVGARKYYSCDMAGFSIPAMEHSTVTSWGRENETKSFSNMMELYAKPNSISAYVSDSYDIYEACRKWGTELKDKVIASGGTIVIRPDSGDPAVVVRDCLIILDKYFGHTMVKGYRLLNNVRIIQGDGINHKSIEDILFNAKIAGYSADNIAFGQGGALLQAVDRDTLKFAMKCSAIAVREQTGNREDGILGKLVWRDVYKDPITDSGKVSKRGRFSVIKNGTKYETVGLIPGSDRDELKPRFMNGVLVNTTTLDAVRERAKI